jgi:hypothetical protein
VISLSEEKKNLEKELKNKNEFFAQEIENMKKEYETNFNSLREKFEMSYKNQIINMKESKYDNLTQIKDLEINTLNEKINSLKKENNKLESDYENLKLEKKNDNSLQNSLLNHKLLNTNTTTNNNNHIVLNQKHTIQNTHQLVNKINLGNSYNIKKLSKSPETKQNNNNSNKKENKIESKISNISLKTNRDRISSGKGKSPLLAKLKLNIDNNLLKEKGLKKNKAEFCKTENNFNNKEIKKKK